MKSKFSYFLFIFSLLMSMISVNVSAQQQTNTNKSIGTAKTSATSKDDDKKLVQLSGVITAPDGYSAIPYATVRILHTFRGTIAGTDGFYSLVAAEKDTIQYTALGFKPVIFVLPLGTTDQKYNQNVSLDRKSVV